MNNQLNDAIDLSNADYEIDSLDLDYIIESIESQLTNLLTDITKKNYLKKFIDKYDKLIKEHPEKSDELNDQKNILYTHIINSIGEKFDISIYTEYVSNMNKFVKTLYKFFIIEYLENITMFLEMYIVENKKDILSEMTLYNENLRNKKSDEIDQNISIILSNLDSVIEIIKSHNLGFRDFLEYTEKHPEATVSISNMLDYYADGFFYDADMIYDNIINSLINEDEGFSNIYTTLQLNLYNIFEAEN